MYVGQWGSGTPMHEDLGRCASVNGMIGSWCRVHQTVCEDKHCKQRVPARAVWTVVDARYEALFLERAWTHAHRDVHAEPDRYWPLDVFLDVVGDIIPVSDPNESVCRPPPLTPFTH